MGPTLELDATGSNANGRSFSLISTAANAIGGPGKLAVWDDTSDLYRLLIDGVNDTVKVRNLALTMTHRNFNAGDSATHNCEPGEVVTGGGCACGDSVDRTTPAFDIDTGALIGWTCSCSGPSTLATVWVMCLKSTAP